jgi:ADP-ribose pyrophosphatase YjhB (NUDIX family)
MFRQDSKLPRPTGPQQKQYAALPYVFAPEGLRVLLLTSRETRRWVIPKGWPIGGLEPHEVAKQEARQEAGIHGTVSTGSIGVYSYRKRLHYFSSLICDVDVFPLHAEQQKLHWRERAQRQLVWLSPSEAALRVQEPELAAILRDFQPDPHAHEKASPVSL